MTRANRKSAAGISLFPFLAVLICTMGSLIMLLVLLMQQARAQAAAESRQREAQLTDEQQQQRDKLRMAAEDESWRAEVLEQQRSEIQQQVAERRLQLSHLEKHIRQLEQQWQTLQAQAIEIAELRDSETSGADPLASEKQRLESELAAVQQQLEQARKSVAERPQAYAIIPYPGPNGTQRRPIYIECTQRGVILQPENILLSVEDFQEPLGPGNPLDAALRTIHEHQKRAFGSQNEASYPLLIVRANGIEAYAAARAAMSGWEDEFGYELVDNDMQLKYPPPDPGLSTELQDTIKVARERQQLRRQAMPTNRGGRAFVVSERHGGLIPVGSSDADPPAGSRPGGSGFGATGAGSTGAGTGSESRGGGANAPAANGQFAGGGSAPSSTNNGATGQAAGGTAGQQANVGSQGANGADGATSAAGPGGARAAGGGTSSGGGGRSRGGGPGASSGVGSLADTRGEDWALHKKTATSTGYRRPVRVVCRADALILVPEFISNDKPQVFAFEQDTTQAIDGFVQALHRRVELWGLPPLGGYWRPQLVVQVDPDATTQFAALEQLLQNSGLEIKRETQ